MTGIAAITIQAPCTNFVAITTMSTSPVPTAPIPFSTMLRCHPLARSPPSRLTFSQCLTMPVWDRVNEVNTPTT